MHAFRIAGQAVSCSAGKATYLAAVCAYNSCWRHAYGLARIDCTVLLMCRSVRRWSVVRIRMHLLSLGHLVTMLALEGVFLVPHSGIIQVCNTHLHSSGDIAYSIPDLYTTQYRITCLQHLIVLVLFTCLRRLYMQSCASEVGSST
jgi:hypothetical protein